MGKGGKRVGIGGEGKERGGDKIGRSGEGPGQPAYAGGGHMIGAGRGTRVVSCTVEGGFGAVKGLGRSGKGGDRR